MFPRQFRCILFCAFGCVFPIVARFVFVSSIGVWCPYRISSHVWIAFLLSFRCIGGFGSCGRFVVLTFVVLLVAMCAYLVLLGLVDVATGMLVRLSSGIYGGAMLLLLVLLRYP